MLKAGPRMPDGKLYRNSMDASVTTRTQGPDARAETLVSSYERAGYVRVAPAMLQPAEPFLDLSGEDIRRRMYLTTAPDGDEFCLRPDLTIPVSRDYLASSIAGQPAGYCYLGPVFRHRTDAPAEFLQAGIESFGRSDKAAADAEMLSLGLEATAHYGVVSPTSRSAMSRCSRASLSGSIFRPHGSDGSSRTSTVSPI